MIPQVTDAKYISDYRVWLRFNDGTEGEVDLAHEIGQGVFAPLSDINYFKNFFVDPELNTIVWNNGADYAPEFLYDKLCH